MNEELSLFPNPAQEELGIRIEKFGIKEVKIYDVMGNVIQQLTTNNKQLTLDVSGLAKGMYFVEVISTGSTTQGERETTLRRKFAKQ